MKQPIGRTAAPALEDVRIRPYGVTDHDRLVRMSDRLSGSSLYTRFFSGTPRIPDYYVAAMDRLDHWDRDALVALVGGEMAGIAEYVRDAREPFRAEIAVLVADPWQRRGLGSRLIGYLTHLAARRGITEFGADVILTNRDALLFIRHGWPAARSRMEEGAARFRLPLRS
ncbi:GNAT family N-acetyltransferase [Actinomadura sp. RB99]|uniref:GNAT family N-acetyltransferase n=1 Tax=Actinomadura sp. RB99 TaxID=2691577 RepID=UPI001F50D820|nr:GNAT family N-acetyltransferase [Actinomadura sp. RB99]